MFRETKKTEHWIDSNSYPVKQKEGESFKQFLNELNGLASKCNFGAITESLVKDVFIVNMNNKEVQ